MPDKERQVLRGIPYMWNLFLKSRTHRNRVEKWLPGSGDQDGGNRERLVKWYKLSVIRYIRFADLM